MFPLSTCRAIPALAASILALALLAACGEGDEEIEPTATLERPTPTAEQPVATPTEAMPSATESGEPPIFWLTADGFASLRADEPYKVLFRITGGYEEETLLVVAERLEDGLRVEFKPLRSQPEGEEAPGSYYPLTLGLPEPGAWELTVIAGEDEATIPVEVAEAEG